MQSFGPHCKVINRLAYWGMHIKWCNLQGYGRRHGRTWAVPTAAACLCVYKGKADPLTQMWIKKQSQLVSLHGGCCVDETEGKRGPVLNFLTRSALRN
ncbi:hypothetical protein BVC80_1831g76 [Macleaya cordata]|uniref:Uncharacterized protein n=1 Tax=Macleaya cordata TaxID=56857 RepID=A0A200R744_MACCD|nr:hypothetical protein BVC80_1831g76 [Macleaya cordata]